MRGPCDPDAGPLYDSVDLEIVTIGGSGMLRLHLLNRVVVVAGARVPAGEAVPVVRLSVARRITRNDTFLTKSEVLDRLAGVLTLLVRKAVTVGAVSTRGRAFAKLRRARFTRPTAQSVGFGTRQLNNRIGIKRRQ
jgi:hypothetical protein